MPDGAWDDFEKWGVKDLAFCKRLMALLDAEGPKRADGRLEFPFRWWRDALADYVRLCEKAVSDGKGKP